MRLCADWDFMLDFEMRKLTKARKFIWLAAGGTSIILAVIWPIFTLIPPTFDQTYFYVWVIVSIAWGMVRPPSHFLYCTVLSKVVLLISPYCSVLRDAFNLTALPVLLCTAENGAFHLVSRGFLFARTVGGEGYVFETWQDFPFMCNQKMLVWCVGPLPHRWSLGGAAGFKSGAQVC